MIKHPMIEFFTAADFEIDGNDTCSSEIAAIANSKLLNHSIRVYGAKYTDERGWAFDQRILVETTHTALLINIQLIEQKPCKHKPNIAARNYQEGITAYDDRCKHCGIELEPIWQVKEK